MGEMTARKRWRELREEALALDVIAALAWTKWIETIVLLAIGTGALAAFVGWLVAALLVTAWYVYEKRLKEAADNAKDAIEETVDSP